MCAFKGCVTSEAGVGDGLFFQRGHKTAAPVQCQCLYLLACLFLRWQKTLVTKAHPLYFSAQLSIPKPCPPMPVRHPPTYLRLSWSSIARLPATHQHKTFFCGLPILFFPWPLVLPSNVCLLLWLFHIFPTMTTNCEFFPTCYLRIMEHCVI